MALHRRLGDPARLRDPHRRHRVRGDELRSRPSGRRSATARPRSSSRSRIIAYAALAQRPRVSPARCPSAGSLLVRRRPRPAARRRSCSGSSLVSRPGAIVDPIHLGHVAAAGATLLFALTVATVAFTGLEAAAGLAGEVAVARARPASAWSARARPSIVVVYVGIALVAISALPVTTGARRRSATRYVDAPVRRRRRGARRTAALADGRCVRRGRRGASSRSSAAANSAMLGLSRAGATRWPPTARSRASLGRLHPRRGTPVVVIVLAALLAAALVVPTDLDFLVGIYAFGAMLAFTIAHVVDHPSCASASPSEPRPYRIPLSVPCRGGAVPLPARARRRRCRCAGWSRSSCLHGGARYVGIGWMVVGLVLYVDLPPGAGHAAVRARHRARAGAARRRRGAASPSSARSSCRSSAAGSTTTSSRRPAAWPATSATTSRATGAIDRGALGLRGADGAAARRAPARGAAQARPRGARAGPRRWGRSTRASRSRRRPCAPAGPGRRSSSEAERRGVEAIVLAAEEPSRIRGGALARRPRRAARQLRGRRHEVRGAQGAVPGDPHRARRDGSPARRARTTAGARAPPRGPSRAGYAAAPCSSSSSERDASGSAVAKRALAAGPRGLGARRGPALARAPRRRQRGRLGGPRRPLHRRHGARDRRADRGRASRRPTSSSPRPTATTRTSSSRRSPRSASRSRKVIARVLDPARADWYAEQGLHTICADPDGDRHVRERGPRREDAAA